MTSSDGDSSEQVLDKTRWNAAKEQYQKDKQAYDSYQDTRKDEAVTFGKAMRPALSSGEGDLSRRYQSTRVAAYNSRAKHSKQEVVPVQGDSKSGFEEDERKMAELRKKMESYKKEALNELEQEAKRERELHERQEQERIRKYGLQRA